jgi:hypothetical protein
MKNYSLSSRIAVWLGVLVLPWLAACSTLSGVLPWSSSSEPGFVILFDGSDLNQWKPVGNANWRLQDKLLQAELGGGFLMSRQSYQDFQLKAEFWVDDAANSGIFVRCTDLQNITATNAYEVNIYDQRPDPSYGTGAIVNVAKVSPMPKAGGHWNSYDITFQGSHMVVYLNGVKTADAEDSRLSAAGPIALQYDKGVVKFRNIRIKAL